MHNIIAGTMLATVRVYFPMAYCVYHNMAKVPNAAPKPNQIYSSSKLRTPEPLQDALFS
jgi:hypothetical protein